MKGDIRFQMFPMEMENLMIKYMKSMKQCPARVGFEQSRKNAIHSFREVQVKKNHLRLRSRNEREIKMTGNRDREVEVK